MNQYDVIIIGAGLSGLSAAALCAKRGLTVAVFENAYNPGGSCGIFRRKHRTFDIGSSMLYGFGEEGFNAHRFLFNALEEPIDMIRHENLYAVNFDDHRITFHQDIQKFADELSSVFPDEKENIHRFYRETYQLYYNVLVENPVYSTPDETDPKDGLKSVMQHPISYMKFLSYLNKTAKSFLQKYFSNPEIFNFFDKMTSTYSYTTVEESPAILAAVMFVDNHVGGSSYPAGSTLFLPGKLEKVIEEHDGDMFYESKVSEILFKENTPCGVKTIHGKEFFAEDIIFSGTVWNLYNDLLPPAQKDEILTEWANKQVPTYPSVVMYSTVKRDVIPVGTNPIEMLVGRMDKLDESEVTAYIPSIDDHTICPDDEHIVLAIGPATRDWFGMNQAEYLQAKKEEKERLCAILEKKFPGFTDNLRHFEVATPKTIERYTLKHGGAVAGPKQMLGQHMFKRQKTRTKWNHLFCCGESTVMGTGTPTVTVSGIAAANAVLKNRQLEPFVYQKGMKDYVRNYEPPFTKEMMYDGYSAAEKEIMHEANRCQLCKNPLCTKNSNQDIRGIMRRVAVGNFTGAKRVAVSNQTTREQAQQFMEQCLLNNIDGHGLNIPSVLDFLNETESV